jgi:hypothetical protein
MEGRDRQKTNRKRIRCQENFKCRVFWMKAQQDNDKHDHLNFE